MTPSVTLSIDPDGIGWIVFDDPAARVNVFNESSLAALDAVLDELGAATGVRAVVLWSGKERIFIAGADLKHLAALPDAAAAEAMSRRGQSLFQRIADLPVPVLAAIHGASAGGGYEVALAAHYRLASESPATLIGLPEVGIGTIPGWGGCARLPRVIGVSAAIEHILAARLVPAEQAKAVGLVDELAPAEGFREAARAVALRLVEAGVPERTLAPEEMGAEAIDARRQSTLAKTRGLQPAPIAVLDVIAKTFGGSLESALLEESRQFGRITVTPECKGLVRTFFLKEAFKKPAVDVWFPAVKAGKPEPIRRIGVIGAGVMGSGIAQWLAAQGSDVVLRDIDDAFLGKARGIMRGLFDEAVKRGKMSAADADAGMARIRTTTGWDGLESCDLIVEAIIEDLAAKQELFAGLAKLVPATTILASNTSALPIDEIGAHIPYPERVIGIHFFNPVSRMPLVEIILSPQTDRVTTDRVTQWVRTIGKSAVICRSSPGFIVTRILFFYLNEALRLWSTQPDTSAIDEAMLDFGMPMGPLRLIDEVGIDVTAFIIDSMTRYYPGRFTPAPEAARLVAAEMKGRKNGVGFYRYEGRKESVNPDAAQAAGVAASGEALAPNAIRERLLNLMIREARGCIDEGIVKSADDIDFAMLLGTGFPAFRGGLTHWAKSVGKL